MEATNETGTNPAGAQSSAGEAGANLTDRLAAAARDFVAACFVERYANGGERCADCKYSLPDGP